MVIWLAGCTPSHAPVVDRYGASAALEPVTRGTHVVKRGDTLYSIAWRYGWDFRQLADANDIAAPYTIYPGQEIRLDARPGTGGTESSRASTPRETARPDATPARPSGKKKSPAASPSGGAAPAWRWPTDGRVLTGFRKGMAGRQGIVLDGSAGDPVHAAAAGTVVYRGSGLTGYGNLLIIKHSERWLSAYAHAREILVKEGQQVDAGQRVATVGDTGTARTQLHFEIRRDGAPVDPASVLPRR